MAKGVSIPRQIAEEIHKELTAAGVLTTRDQLETIVQKLVEKGEATSKANIEYVFNRKFELTVKSLQEYVEKVTAELQKAGESRGFGEIYETAEKLQEQERQQQQIARGISAVEEILRKESVRNEEDRKEEKVVRREAMERSKEHKKISSRVSQVAHTKAGRDIAGGAAAELMGLPLPGPILDDLKDLYGAGASAGRAGKGLLQRAGVLGTRNASQDEDGTTKEEKRKDRMFKNKLLVLLAKISKGMKGGMLGGLLGGLGRGAMGLLKLLGKGGGLVASAMGGWEIGKLMNKYVLNPMAEKLSGFAGETLGGFIYDLVNDTKATLGRVTENLKGVFDDIVEYTTEVYEKLIPETVRKGISKTIDWTKKAYTDSAEWFKDRAKQTRVFASDVADAAKGIFRRSVGTIETFIDVVKEKLFGEEGIIKSEHPSATSLGPSSPRAGVDSAHSTIMPGGISQKGESSGLADMARNIAKEEGVDPNLFARLVQAESSWDPSATSPAGAQGLSQLMPGTAKEMGVSDPFDAQQNLRGGAKYLKKMLDANNGDQRLALASYNAGLGNVRKHGGVPPFEETQNYVNKILGPEGVSAGGSGSGSAYDVASSMRGKNENANRKEVGEFLKAGKTGIVPSQPWCSAFVNSALEKSGIQGTRSGMARSFQNWGRSVPLSAAQKGDVVVFSRGGNPAHGHVGFYEGLDSKGNILVLGGNQSDSVTVAPYPQSRLLSVRRAGPEQMAGGGAGAGTTGVAGMPGGTAQPGGSADGMVSGAGSFVMGNVNTAAPGEAAPPIMAVSGAVSGGGPAAGAGGGQLDMGMLGLDNMGMIPEDYKLLEQNHSGDVI